MDQLQHNQSFVYYSSCLFMKRVVLIFQIEGCTARSHFFRGGDSQNDSALYTSIPLDLWNRVLNGPVKKLQKNFDMFLICREWVN